MFLYIVFLIPMALFSMERQESIIEVPRNSANNSFYNVSDSSDSIGNDEADLCDFAMSRYSSIRRHVDPYLRNVLREVDNSPHASNSSSNAETLRRIKSGEMAEVVDRDRIIHDMVMKAMSQAFDQKEKDIAAREKRIKEKYSGKKTAAIAAVAATVSTIVTTICTTIITMKTSK